MGPAPTPGYNTVLSNISGQHVQLEIIDDKVYYILEKHRLGITNHWTRRGDSNWLDGIISSILVREYTHPIKTRNPLLNLRLENISYSSVSYMATSPSNYRSGVIMSGNISRSGVLNEVKLIIGRSVLSAGGSFNVWTSGARGTNNVNVGGGTYDVPVYIALEVIFS